MEKYNQTPLLGRVRQESDNFAPILIKFMWEKTPDPLF